MHRVSANSKGKRVYQPPTRLNQFPRVQNSIYPRPSVADERPTRDIAQAFTGQCRHGHESPSPYIALAPTHASLAGWLPIISHACPCLLSLKLKGLAASHIPASS